MEQKDTSKAWKLSCLEESSKDVLIGSVWDFSLDMVNAGKRRIENLKNKSWNIKIQKKLKKLKVKKIKLAKQMTKQLKISALLIKLTKFSNSQIF